MLACGPDREQLTQQKAAEQAAEILKDSASKRRADAEAIQADADRMRARMEMYKRRSWAKLRQSGELGPHAGVWLEARADQGGAIEAIIHKGRNITALTKDLSPALNEATDDARAVEAFAVEVEAERATPAIMAMARNRELGPVRIGFGELGHTSEGEPPTDDWGYLVAWFHHGAVVGFIYHSTRQLELDAVETETAKLVESMRAELPKRGE